MTCTLSAGTITMTGGLSVIVAASTTVQIVLSPVTNPITSQVVPASLTIQSYVDPSLVYTYDLANTGMVVKFPCTYPCKTCTS